MDIRQDHFDLLGLPRRFSLDSARLDAAYRSLQAKVHPDRHVGPGDAERRVAQQWSTHVNSAYQTLRDPLLRARYLCELQGAAIDAESNTAMPPDFLMRQLEWREALATARQSNDRVALEALQHDWQEARRDEIENLRLLLDDSKELSPAVAAVRRLMFLEKFGNDIAEADELIEA